MSQLGCLIFGACRVLEVVEGKHLEMKEMCKALKESEIRRQRSS